MAPSTYYAAKTRPPSARAQRDATLLVVLAAMHAANFSVYGARKMWKAMVRAGHDVGRDQVARLMREAGLRGVRRSKRVRTTKRDDAAPRSPDLVERNFTATAPNQLWVTDLTFVPTWAGIAYVCFITDAFSRMIVGWRVAGHMRTEMVLDALEMARWQRGTRLEDLRCHSDAGSQGGFNRSSQHLDVEVRDEQTAWMDSHADWKASDAIAGTSASSSRCGTGVLGQDRRRTTKRGSCDRMRCVGPGRQPLVPRTWRHAVHRTGPVDGQVSVLC